MRPFIRGYIYEEIKHISCIYRPLEYWLILDIKKNTTLFTTSVVFSALHFPENNLQHRRLKHYIHKCGSTKLYIR